MESHDKQKEAGKAKDQQNQNIGQSRPDSLGTIGSESSDARQEQVRVTQRYEYGKHSGFFLGGVIGGIIEQSISQVDERLREYSDCVVWYQDAVEKAHAQKAGLEELKRQIEQYFSQSEEEE